MGHRSRLYLVLCQIYRNIIEEAKILPKNSSKAIIAKDPCFSVYNTKWWLTDFSYGSLFLILAKDTCFLVYTTIW